MSFDREAWDKMEAQATAMTHEKYEKQKEIDEKLEAIRKYNKEHPIQTGTPIVVYENKPDPLDPMEIAKASARWIGTYHAGILGGFGFGSTKK